RRAERSERLLRGAHPVRDRTEPAVAVRRPGRPAIPHIEGMNPDMQVKRQRRAKGKFTLPWRFGNTRVRVVTAAAVAATLVVTGTGLAFATTNGFGTDQVGQGTSQGTVVSDHQIINPIGRRPLTPLGEFM